MLLSRRRCAQLSTTHLTNASQHHNREGWPGGTSENSDIMLAARVAWTMEVLLDEDWLSHDDVVGLVGQIMQQSGGFDSLSPGVRIRFCLRTLLDAVEYDDWETQVPLSMLTKISRLLQSSDSEGLSPAAILDRLQPEEELFKMVKVQAVLDALSSAAEVGVEAARDLGAISCEGHFPREGDRPVELLEVLKDPAILPAVMARYPKTALAESIRSYVATARQALGPCNIQAAVDALSEGRWMPQTAQVGQQAKRRRMAAGESVTTPVRGTVAAGDAEAEAGLEELGRATSTFQGLAGSPVLRGVFAAAEQATGQAVPYSPGVVRRDGGAQAQAGPTHSPNAQPAAQGQTVHWGDSRDAQGTAVFRGSPGVSRLAPVRPVASDRGAPVRPVASDRRTQARCADWHERKPWSAAETRLLIQHVDKMGLPIRGNKRNVWGDFIAHTEGISAGRTAVDAKDKWRNLLVVKKKPTELDALAQAVARKHSHTHRGSPATGGEGPDAPEAEAPAASDAEADEG